MQHACIIILLTCLYKGNALLMAYGAHPATHIIFQAYVADPLVRSTLKHTGTACVIYLFEFCGHEPRNILQALQTGSYHLP